mmetsp:Transcript_46417/g.125188  ORF Transcript_46417/g.125188 Transcript_46417/m.125188 type:complete len:306 (-) Transcript_46417:70-987(-)
MRWRGAPLRPIAADGPLGGHQDACLVRRVRPDRVGHAGGALGRWARGAKVEVQQHARGASEVGAVQRVVVRVEVVLIKAPRRIDGHALRSAGVGALVGPGDPERHWVEEVGEEHPWSQEARQRLREDPEELLVHAAAVDVGVERRGVVQVVVHLVGVLIDDGHVSHPMLDIEADREAGPANRVKQPLAQTPLLRDIRQQAREQHDGNVEFLAVQAAQDYDEVRLRVEGPVQDVHAEPPWAKGLGGAPIDEQVQQKIDGEKQHDEWHSEIEARRGECRNRADQEHRDQIEQVVKNTIRDVGAESYE